MNLSKVLEEKKNLEKQIKAIALELRRMPKKSIYCTRNGTAYKWYETNGKVSKYIPKSERKYAEKLARKKYLLTRKKDLQQELKAVEEYLKCRQMTEANETKFKENSAYAELLAPYESSVSQEIQEWMRTAYERNEGHPEHLIYQTTAGFSVRSKSEALIVMLLHTKKIPFRYECLLKLGGIILYPDFTIKHPKTGKIFYYEHFGKMDDVEYVKNVFTKLQSYVNYGIIPGINLILTFETKEHPLEVELVEQLLDYYFLN